MEGEGFEVARYVPEDQQGLPAEEERSLRRDAYASTAEDIARSGLYIHEVILDPGEDPRRLVEALAAGPLGTVGIAALCAVDRADRADTWLSVIEATNDYPVEAEGIETVVLVIDPTAVMDVLEAIVDGDEPEVGIDGAIVGDLDRLVVDGPLAPPIAGMDVTHKAMAGWLADMLGELRQLGEQTGMRIVLVTCDSRPQHAYGNLQRSHFFRDARVRSSIGDAGRYFAHQRYRIEPAVKTTYRRPYITLDETEDGETIFEEHLPYEEHEYVTGSVVVIKDEAEGLPGRIVYGSSAALSPR